MRLKLLVLFLCIMPSSLLFSLSGNKVDITQYIIADNGTYFGISRSYGFVVSSDQGISWEQRNTGLPKQVVYPFTGEETIHLTSIAADPIHQNRIAVTSYWALYISDDAGASWKSVPLKKPIKHTAYITSAAISPFSDNTYLIGTSFSGIFQTANGGETWTEYKDMLEPVYRGAGFYEEISALTYDPYSKGLVYAAAGFGNGLYKADLANEAFTRIHFPGDDTRQYIKRIICRSKTELDVETAGSLWTYRPDEDKWEQSEGKKSFRIELPENKTARLQEASDRYGIYVKSWNAGGDMLKEKLKFVKDQGMNAIVVDMKDDMGRITYNTNLELPQKIGALRNDIDLEELIKTAHESGVYVIGRVVCFQDPQLYKYENNKYAVWNSEEQAPWGNKIKVVNDDTGEAAWVQREFWVDPFSEFVWNYNLSIAEELQERGIDEIQFDYIRFPSDGNFSGTQYRYQPKGMKKIDALESFLRMVREHISIPLSTDLYGFNSWYRMGNWIGQCIEMVSYYVDVICPMYYPSHFPRTFKKDTPYLKRAKEIYQEGSDRAAAITEGRSIIRPYVQAFLMSGELKFDEPVYWDYLLKQIEGVKAGKASGFTLWNNSNRYYMVVHNLSKKISDG